MNILDGYHVTNNLLLDCMHDYLEGVCKYDIIEILIHVTNSDYISLENINWKMNAINFHKFTLNKPPLVKTSFLAKRDIAFSASEMKIKKHDFFMVGLTESFSPGGQKPTEFQDDGRF